MSSSNLEEVGQIRRRRGTSINKITNADALYMVSLDVWHDAKREPYMAKAQKIMRTTLNEKMLAIPTAREMIMERIPSLYANNVSPLSTAQFVRYGSSRKEELDNCRAMIEAVYSGG
jgi:hypothetical protein